MKKHGAATPIHYLKGCCSAFCMEVDFSNCIFCKPGIYRYYIDAYLVNVDVIVRSDEQGSLYVEGYMFRYV